MTAALPRRSPVPGRHVYDAIVIGGQLSGVLTAALLARHGLHVLLVPHDGLSAPYSHGDWRLPHVPFIMPPLKEIPLLEEQLVALGVTSVFHRQLRPVGLQILEPRRRIELFADEAQRQRELDRALGPLQAQAFENVLKQAAAAALPSDPFFSTHPEFPPEGVLARWKFRRLLARAEGLDVDTPLPTDSPLRRLLPLAAGVHCAAPLTRARALGHLVSAPTMFPGGREGLLSVLHERARELGADVLLPDDAVEYVTFEGSHAAGVRLTRGDTVFRAPWLVGACDLDVLLRLVPEERRRRAELANADVTSSEGLFTMNVVVPERALPRGLGELAIVEAKALETKAVLLHICAARTAAGADAPDFRVLSLSITAPTAIRAQGEPAIRALGEKVWSAIEELLPFTRAKAVLESLPWLDAPHVVAGRGDPLPLFLLPGDSWLGVSGHGPSSPFKRLLLASRQVLPGLGIEGEALAAAQVVRRIETALNKNDPLKTRKTA